MAAFAGQPPGMVRTAAHRDLEDLLARRGVGRWGRGPAARVVGDTVAMCAATILAAGKLARGPAQPGAVEGPAAEADVAGADATVAQLIGDCQQGGGGDGGGGGGGGGHRRGERWGGGIGPAEPTGAHVRGARRRVR